MFHHRFFDATQLCRRRFDQQKMENKEKKAKKNLIIPTNSLELLVILNPIGYMLTTSGFALLVLGIIYRLFLNGW